jgi:hypothetical protein
MKSSSHSHYNAKRRQCYQQKQQQQKPVPPSDEQRNTKRRQHYQQKHQQQIHVSPLRPQASAAKQGLPAMKQTSRTDSQSTNTQKNAKRRQRYQQQKNVSPSSADQATVSHLHKNTKRRLLRSQQKDHQQRHASPPHRHDIPTTPAVNPSDIAASFHAKCQSSLPIYDCSCCERLMFPHQVTKFNFTTLAPQLSAIPSLSDTSFTSWTWICHTCKNHLKHCRLPPQAAANALHLQPVPSYIKDLNPVERHLISPVIPFMKIFPLPKSMMKGIHGPCVCIPSDVSQVTDTLPRSFDDTSLIKVKLKRKLEYKGHHMYHAINPANMTAALNHLKHSHPAFEGMYSAIMF